MATAEDVDYELRWRTPLAELRRQELATIQSATQDESKRADLQGISEAALERYSVYQSLVDMRVFVDYAALEETVAKSSDPNLSVKELRSLDARFFGGLRAKTERDNSLRFTYADRP